MYSFATFEYYSWSHRTPIHPYSKVNTESSLSQIIEVRLTVESWTSGSFFFLFTFLLFALYTKSRVISINSQTVFKDDGRCTWLTYTYLNNIPLDLFKSNYVTMLHRFSKRKFNV